MEDQRIQAIEFGSGDVKVDAMKFSNNFSEIKREYSPPIGKHERFG